MTERVEIIMGRGKGGTILVHVGTNNADNGDCGQVQELTEEDEGS